MRSFLVSIFLLASVLTHAQHFSDTIPFQDKKTKQWGFQDRKTKSIVIPANYTSVRNFYHGYAVVEIDKKFGVINLKEEKISPFIMDELMFEFCAECPVGKLRAVRDYGDWSTHRIYYVNLKCQCEPAEYYTCPADVAIDTSRSSKSLRLIQKAEYELQLGDLDKALKYADLAAAADTNSAFPLFWKAAVIVHDEHPFYNVIYNKISDREIEIHQQERKLKRERESWEKEMEAKTKALEKNGDDEALDKLYEMDTKKTNDFEARENDLDQKQDKIYNSYDSLDAVNDQFTALVYEHNDWIYSTANKILRTEPEKSSIWYSALALKHRTTENPEEKKAANKILKKENMRNVGGIESFGIVAGYGIGNMQHADLTLAMGVYDRINAVFDLTAYTSLGFEYGIDQRIDAFKSTAGFHGPVHFMISPMLFTDYTHWKFGFRPEIGVAIKTLSFSYGYTLVNKEFFTPARGHIFKAKIFVPLYRPEKEYASYRGNNIYWE